VIEGDNVEWALNDETSRRDLRVGGARRGDTTAMDLNLGELEPAIHRDATTRPRQQTSGNSLPALDFLGVGQSQIIRS
jgi:hypothetical protein